MIYEPDDEWPYKLLYWDSLDVNPDHWGIFATRSKDGIHFESLGNVLHKWDDRFVAVTDKVDGKYRVYGRGTFETGVERAGLWKGRTDFVTEYGLDPFPRKRPVSYTESEDLIHWTPGEQVMKTGTDDPWQMQYYSLTPFYYEGIWLAVCCACTPSPTCWRRNWCGATTGATGTAASPGSPSSRAGPRAASTRCGSTCPPIRPSSTTTNCGSTTPAGPAATARSSPEAYGAIGLATLRIDGFCSMYGGEQSGAILTKPVTWPGGELLVNADPRRDISGHHSGDDGTYGSVRVEIRDAENKPLDGYRFADCNPVARNTRDFKEEPVWTAPERDNLAVQAVDLEGWTLRPRAGGPAAPALLRGQGRPPVLIPCWGFLVPRKQFLTAGPDPAASQRPLRPTLHLARRIVLLGAQTGHAIAMTNRGPARDLPTARTCCALCAAPSNQFRYSVAGFMASSHSLMKSFQGGCPLRHGGVVVLAGDRDFAAAAGRHG